MVGWNTTGSRDLKKIPVSLCAVTKLSLTRHQPQPLPQHGYASSSQSRPGLLAGQESVAKSARILVWGWAQNWDNNREVLGAQENPVGDTGFLQENKTVCWKNHLTRAWATKLGCFIFFFFHFLGEVRGRQGLRQGMEKKPTA